MSTEQTSANLSIQVGQSRHSRAPAEIRLTRRQKRFLRVLAEKPWRSFADAAREAGYAESVARKPSIIFESPTVRYLWESCLEAQCLEAQCLDGQD
jgi:hypothetical protein